MAQQVINVGAVANDRTGDDWRDAWTKQIANTTELYSINTVLTNRADVLANGTLALGVLSLNQGTYVVLGNIDMAGDVIEVGQATLIKGNSSAMSSITTNSSAPTITFNGGGFSSSGIKGDLGIAVNNTGIGAVMRAESVGTIVFFENIISSAGGTGLEINNASGVDIDAWRMTGTVTNGIVITGAANAGPRISGLDLAGISGKGVDIQGTITAGTVRLTRTLIETVGIGIDVPGTIIDMSLDGDVLSTGSNALKVAGTISGGVGFASASFASSTDEAIDIRGGTIGSGLVTGSSVVALAASKSALIGDASVSGSSPNFTGNLIVSDGLFSAGAGAEPLTGLSKKDLNVTFRTVTNIVDSITLGCFTLDAQSTTTINFQGLDGAITAYADAGSGSTTVTSAGHGMGNGEPVAIIDTTAYNGLFTTAAITASTFDIVRAFVTDEATGNFESGWEKIAGATSDCPTIERFQGSADNEQEYLDSNTIPVTYNAVIAGQKSGATAQLYEFGVFSDLQDGNGFVKINGSIPRDMTNRSGSLTLRIPTEIITGGKFTAFTRNKDANVDFIGDALTVDIGFG